MRSLAYILTLVLAQLSLRLGDFRLDRIARLNEATAQAQIAQEARQYGLAASLYRRAVDSLGASSEITQLNLAHCLYLSGQNREARLYYGRLVNSVNREIRSAALTQLAVLTGKRDKATTLDLLKAALKADPNNQQARYNFELALRWPDKGRSSAKRNQPEEPDESPYPGYVPPSPKPQASQAGGNQGAQVPDPSQSGEGNSPQAQENFDAQEKNRAGAKRVAGSGDAPDLEVNPGEGSTQGRGGWKYEPQADELARMGMSVEKAKGILDMLQNRELQFIQQQRRKGRLPAEEKPGY